MKKGLQKFIVSLIAIMMVIQPYLMLPNHAKASETEDAPTDLGIDPEEENFKDTDQEDSGLTTEDADLSADGGGETSYEKAKPVTLIANRLRGLAHPEDSGSSFTFEENIVGVGNAKIVLHPNDFSAIKALYYLGQNLPDFENDLHLLWNNLPANNRPESEDALLVVKIENPTLFDTYVETARKVWLQTDDGKKLNNIKALSVITGYSENYLTSLTEAERQEYYDSMIESLKMDIRVLKTIVYLVTPKDQGGAGHWKIKVRKIMQFAGRPLSTESDQVLIKNAEAEAKNNATPATQTNVDCEGLTASECGQKQREAGNDGSSDADVVTTDANGDEWEGYLNGVDTEEDALKQRNISAHSTGQAIDISVVDDIRCTLIKKRRIGGDKKEKQPARPIKLAWQTNEGYAASGGNPIDTMGILKASMTDDVRELIASLGGDISDYEGDLSTSSLSDIVGLVGKSLFAQILNSPSHNLAGYDISDTMKNLGGMYFADYFGLPREIFIGREYSSIDDIEEIIGQSALEKRMRLPYGSLSSKNLTKTLVNANSSDTALRGKAVYDLEGTFINIGQRKLEYEMNLNAGTLSTYISQPEKEKASADFDLLIGQRVIEKELSLKEGAFEGKFEDIKKKIGKIKYDLTFKDPTYLDNVLHLDPGTSKEMIKDSNDSGAYASKVGLIRKNDTLSGLRYFAASDSAYSLPEGTWDGMMLGKRLSFITAGYYTLGRLIGTNELYSKYIDTSDQSEEVKEAIGNGLIIVNADPDDIGIAAMQKWLNENLAKNDDTSCKMPDELKTNSLSVTVRYSYDLERINQRTNEVYTEEGNQRNAMPTIPGTENDVPDDSSDDGGTTPPPLPHDKTVSLDVKISQEKALSLGLEQDDLFNMFGCGKSSTKWVFERLGSKILFYGIANKLLSKDEKAKIDLLDTDPQFKTDNPEINFYLNRIATIKDVIEKIKKDWQNQSKPDGDNGVYVLIQGKIDEIYNLIKNYNLSILDQTVAKQFIREFIQKGGELKLLVEQTGRQLPQKLAIITGVVLDINNLIRLASEILAGKSIPNAESITVAQIDASVFNETDNSDKGASYEETGFSTGASIKLVFDFLARRVDPAQFFMKLSCGKAERQLNLPPNALFYLIMNYEKNGIGGVDAFYSAIGQAQIEDVFGMPNFYFQGHEFGKDMPNFSTNPEKLVEYAKEYVLNIKSLLSIVQPAIIRLDNQEFVKLLAVSFPDYYQNTIAVAKTTWKQKEEEEKKISGLKMDEQTLSDVVDNIDAKGLGDALRKGDFDILFRMGIVNKSVSSLRNGSVDSSTQRALEAVDKKLGLPAGSTLALIKDQKPKLTRGEDLLTQDEKKRIEAVLDIRVNTLNVYLRLLNGEIKISDLKGEGLEPDYNVTNPYAKQDPNAGCAVHFSVEGGFSINNQYLDDDSFCINDQDGRHCFENKNEAIRYQDAHQDRKFENVLDSIALSLSKAITSNPNSTITTVEIKDKLVKLINGENNINALLSEDNLNIINNIQTENTIVPIDAIRKIFIRDAVSAPLIDYKIAVGKFATARLLRDVIYNELGIRIDPDLFDSGIIYEILSGNYEALLDMGTTMVEEYIGEKVGMIRAILKAANKNTLECALSQAGSALLGGLLGLDSVSIRGRIVNNIGEAMVEEAINLPKGSFKGGSIQEVMIKAKPINFAVSFKIPLGIINPITNDCIVEQNDLVNILGKDVAEMIKDASDQYKLEKIQAYINSVSTISADASRAISNIDTQLMAYMGQLFSGFTGKLAEEPSGGFNDSNKNLKPFYEESKKFNELLARLDRNFYLNSETHTTGELFQKKENSEESLLTPDQYIFDIGSRKLVEFGATELAEALGFSEETIEAAKEVIKNISDVTRCNGTKDSSGHETCNDQYKNYSSIYELFSSIFKINLDSQAGYSAGTFSRIFSDPNQALNIVLGEEAKKLDAKLGLNPEEDLTFSELYEMYNTVTENREKEEESCEAQYQDMLLTIEQLREQVNDPTITDEERANATNMLAQYEERVNQVKHNCMKYNRSNKNENNDYGKALVASLKKQLSQDILKIVNNAIGSDNKRFCSQKQNNCIDMPLEDVEKLVFGGELIYLEIVATSMAVNYILNSMNEKEMVPASMRISYEDIKMAYFPDKSAINAAKNYAAWAYENGEAYDAYGSPYSYGDLCPTTGNIAVDIVNCASSGSIPPRTESSVIEGTNGQMQYGYGCVTTTDGVTTNNCANLDPDYSSKKLQALEEAEALAESAIPDYCKEEPGINTNECQALNSNHKNAVAETSAFKADQADAERNLKKSYREMLQYRLADQMLYKLDKNIFPGFTRALMKGDGKTKTAVLIQYFSNALRSGEIFGHEFGAIENLDLWLNALKMVGTIINGKEYTFDDFVGSGYFDLLSKYVSKNFEEWFGFYIDPTMAGGLLMGFATGHWGQFGENTDSREYGGKNIPTFLGVATKWLETKIFSWADKQLGLPAGTTYGWYQKAKKIYEATKLYNQIVRLTNRVYGGLYLTEASRAADLEKLNKLLPDELKKEIEAIKASKVSDIEKNGQINDLVKQEKQRMVNDVILQLVVEIFLTFLHKAIGNAVSNLEEALGLVPGSMMTLIDAGVTFAIQTIAHSLFPSLFHVASTGALVAAVIIFALMNLFGYYKVELRCNADGYYTRLDNPQPSLYDVSDLGVWDGMNAKQNQNMSIKAAQYKANRLIQDVLQMHENPLYEDVIPSQIMTGRQEDAELLADSIQVNICSKLGTEVKNGICDGTLAGVWGNPQTVAWTHIGF